LVEPRDAERQRGVHVEVAVDEGRRDQPAARVDNLGRLAGDPFADRGDPAARAGDVDAALPIREIGIPDQEIEHQRSPLT
jgi:hypothetical protein